MDLLKQRLKELVNSSEEINLPGDPMGAYDPITAWEFDESSGGFYLTRSAEGRTFYERDRILSLSRFDLATLSDLPIINISNSPIASDVRNAINNIYSDDIKAVKEYWKLLSSQQKSAETESKPHPTQVPSRGRKKSVARMRRYRGIKTKKQSEDPSISQPQAYAGVYIES